MSDLPDAVKLVMAEAALDECSKLLKKQTERVESLERANEGLMTQW